MITIESTNILAAEKRAKRILGKKQVWVVDITDGSQGKEIFTFTDTAPSFGG